MEANLDLVAVQDRGWFNPQLHTVQQDVVVPHATDRSRAILGTDHDSVGGGHARQPQAGGRIAADRHLSHRDGGTLPGEF
jgi:hypothetical protein